MVAYVRKSRRSRRRWCRTGRGPGCRSRPSSRPASGSKLDEARQGIFAGARDGGGAPHPGAPGRLVAAPRRRRAAGRARDHPRGAPPVLLSGRGAAGARGARRAVRLSHRAARPDLVHPGRERLRPRAALGRAGAASTRRSRPASSRPRTCCTTFRPASTRPSWRGDSSARSRGWRASFSRDTRAWPSR